MPAITSAVTHGAADAIVKKEVIEQHRARIAHAQIHIMPDAVAIPASRRL